MELVTICLCRQKVRFTDEDEALICPHCRRWLDLKTGRIESVDGSRQGKLTEHVLGIDGQTYRFSCENTDFRVNSIVTLSFCQGKIVGVSDDSRKLYFPVWAPSRSPFIWLTVILPLAALYFGGVVPMLVAAVLLAPLFFLKEEEEPDFSGWQLD